MSQPSSAQVRAQFLEFFQKHKHTLAAPSPVTPFDDPTLLFINAGMNPFKPYFLGKETPPSSQIVSAQKCIRVGGKHNDLENVGHTTRHLTFFEMLGNFSFGSYFKQQAIAFAWDFTCNYLQFPPENVWVSVFTEDDEAYELWKKWVPEKRIVKMEAKDNFWQMGETGPCGPCSELLYDRGESFSQARSPLEDPSGERFLEFWNLVFMEQEILPSQKRVELPQKNIDTGAGLERLMMLKGNHASVFGTDILQALIQKTSQICGISYQENTKTAAAFHVIADHIRTLSFAISDGALPGNVDRGYVLRKVLRRAVRYGKTLGFTSAFLGKLVPVLTEQMGQAYPQLISSEETIQEVLTKEEDSFFHTLKRGGNLMQQVIEKSQKTQVISGEAAFLLKDTYGFPLEEILLLAKDAHLKVDTLTYRKLEQQAREKSKKARGSLTQNTPMEVWEKISKKTSKLFVGYKTLKTPSSICHIIKEQKEVSSLEQGETGLVVLDRTPFYAEKGGQVADQGTLTHENMIAKVEHVFSPGYEIIAHKVTVLQGTLCIHTAIEATVDAHLRKQIAQNHTATHLLHFALEKELGSHIQQAGSLVEADRIRFDFSHHKPVTREEKQSIERWINEKIQENLAVQTTEIPLEEAKKQKEIKQFFGEKYQSMVRVVSIGLGENSCSKELCGGTHTLRTGNIGTFLITTETGIAAGVRRIEAVTGEKALQQIQEKENLLLSLTAQFKCSLSNLQEKAAKLLADHTLLQKDYKDIQEKQLKLYLQNLQEKAVQKKPFFLVCAEIPFSIKQLSLASQILAKSYSSHVIVLASQENTKCSILIKVSQDLSFHAKELLTQVASMIEGGGGGRKDLAQAGGKNPANLSLALNKLQTLILS